MSDSITNRCLTELGAIKKAKSAKSKSHSVERWQRCLENTSHGSIKTGLKMSKKDKQKLKAGKKI